MALCSKNGRPAAYRATTGRPRERGFALLIVFMMAAAIALLLYQQMPRVAFESQRDKEDLLIERGEQYKRAIKLYYIEFKKYPSKIDDLESSNNMRFLRHRFVDPMTGKDDWRLIHANGQGALIDSQNVKPPAPGGPNQLAGSNSGGANPSSPSTFGTNTPGANGPNTFGASTAPGSNTGFSSPGFGSNPTTSANTGFGSNTNGFGSNPAATPTPPDPNAPPAPVNAAVLRRPSDRLMTPPTGTNTSFDPNAPAGSAYDPNDPRYWPPISLTTATPGGQGTPGQPGQNGTTQQGFTPQFPGQQFPGQQYPGQPNPAQSNPGGQLNPGGQYNGQQFTGQGLQGQFGVQLPGQLPNQQINPAPQQVVPVTPPILPGQPGFDPSSGGYGPDGTWIPNPPANQQPGVFQPGVGQPGINQPGLNQPGLNQPGFNQAGFNPAGFNPAGGQYPGQPGTGQPGMGQPGAGGNAAISTINNMLRTPQQTQPTSAFSSDPNGITNSILVGVATKFESPSIKIYKDHQKYNQWEFIFDLKSDLPVALQTANPLGANGQPNSGQPGQPNSGQVSTGGMNQNPFTPGSSNPVPSN